jgi:hypothetical protein
MSSSPARLDWRRLVVAGLVVLVAVAIRVWLGNLGYNRDVESYVIVERIVDSGGNVYAGTPRYNYGPPWSYVVHAVALAARAFADSWTAFLLLLSLLLALVDVIVAGLLLERYGGAAAALFLLSPVAIVISGFHRQFDNVAVMLAMLAVLLLDRSRAGRVDAPYVGGLVVLGLSLSVKHLFFAFPLWLALKEQRWPRRLAALAVPPAVFLLSFAPFWAEGRAGIVGNVFLYRSLSNAPLWRTVFGPELGGTLGPTALLVAALAAGAWLDRRRDRLGSLLVYTVALVAFAPALANQYLAIPVAAVSAFPNPLFVCYTVVAGAHLVFDPVETGPFISRAIAGSLPDLYPVEAALLLAGLVWMAVAPRLRRGGPAPRPRSPATGAG